jgi:twitching motility protein PilI
MSSSAAPFDVLRDIASRSRQCASGLPAQDDAVELWNGIGFTIAGDQYVAPMGSISEILHLPKYTKIPGVKNWMLGAANVRGRLLPIMDLALFFEIEDSVVSNMEKRVLVVEHGDILSGLIVGSVQGMQYFSADTFHPYTNNVQETVRPFTQGAYEKNKTMWRVFDTSGLTADRKFLDVSIW